MADSRLRDRLADSMCRHSLIDDWYEKADLVLVDLQQDRMVPTDEYVTVHVAVELLADLGEWSRPLEVQVIETPGRGTGYEMTFRVPDDCEQLGYHICGAGAEITEGQA